MDLDDNDNNNNSAILFALKWKFQVIFASSDALSISNQKKKHWISETTQLKEIKIDLLKKFKKSLKGYCGSENMKELSSKKMEALDEFLLEKNIEIVLSEDNQGEAFKLDDEKNTSEFIKTSVSKNISNNQKPENKKNDQGKNSRQKQVERRGTYGYQSEFQGKRPCEKDELFETLYCNIGDLIQIERKKHLKVQEIDKKAAVNIVTRIGQLIENHKQNLKRNIPQLQK